MIKSKYFVFIGVVTALLLFFLVNTVTSAEATTTRIINMTPTPTGTPVEVPDTPPGEIPSVEEQEELKAFVQSYIEMRYRALSASDSEDSKQKGFESLIADTGEAKDFLSEEKGRLAVEIKHAQLDHLRYVNYKVFLDFHSITVDPSTQTATILLSEGNEVIYEISAELNPENPIISHTAGVKHNIVLHKKKGQWQIISDTYNDNLWKMLRQSGTSTEEILRTTDEMLLTMQASPKPARRSTNTETTDTFLMSDDPSYDRASAVKYALKYWGGVEHAYSNPAGYNINYAVYSEVGGDCQNFVSQALYEGGNISMSIPAVLPSPSLGGDTDWYYLNPYHRAAAWTQVDQFHEFVTNTFYEGPKGSELHSVNNAVPAGLELGDVIQYDLKKDGEWDGIFDHTAIVVGFEGDMPYVAAHTDDFDRVPYNLRPDAHFRFIHIEKSNGNPPVKAEMNSLSDPADDAGGNPGNPCLNTNGDSGNNYFGSCFNGGDITSGFLFRGVQIPKGSQIKYAYITFTTDGTYVTANPNLEAGEVLAPISLKIYGEENSMPSDFSPTNTPANPNRTLTTSWAPWPINRTNEPYDKWLLSVIDKRTTPDIATIIQEIVGLDGWNYGNPLSIIFKNALPGQIYARRVLAIERVSPAFWSARLVAAYTTDDNPTTALPRVYSVTRESASPTNAASVNFIVQFTEPVTGVDGTDFDLPPTDEPVKGAKITSVTPNPMDASLYTVHVNTGSGGGVIKLIVKNTDTNIEDLQHHALNGGFTTGESYTIDKTAPYPVSITLASPNPTKAASVDFIVTFSEYVAGVDKSNFELIHPGISSASITSVNPLTSKSYTISVYTGSGDGTLRLVLLPNSTITDLATNPLDLIVPFISSGSYTIDKVSPTASSSTLASTNPTSSSTVDFTITFPEPVSGVDITDFTLTTTGVFGAAINSISGSGSEYTVTVNTGNMDGTIRLDIPADASITDIIGNPLTGLPYTNGEAYTVTKPIIPFEGDEFNGPELAAGWQWYVPNPGPTYSLTAVPGALRMSLPASAYFEHWGTNDYAPQLRHIGLDDTNWVIETRLEDINAAADAGYWAAMEVGFDQYDQIWFGMSDGGYLQEIRTTGCCSISQPNQAGPITLRLEKLGEKYTFLYKHDTDVDWSELATENYVGTPLYVGLIGRSWNTGSSDLEFDWSYFHIEPWFAPPTVSTITRKDVNPTNAGTVDFTVSFSEAVTGVDSNDFSLSTVGLSGAAISAVNGSGSTYTVTVQTGSGEGTLRLDVLDNDTIINTASKPLEEGFTSGETYTVDRIAPSVTSIVRASSDPTNETSVEFTIEFSENVTHVDLSDFTLTTSGVSGATLSDISEWDNVYTVTVNTGAGSGTIRLDLADNDTIVDAIGNPLGGVGINNGNFTNGEVYTVDKNITLTVTSVAAQDGYVLESTETSNVGGSVNTAATTLFVGDDAQDRQYRSLLSFGTSGLPDNAVIVSATLKLKLQGVVGTSPFTTHSSLVADIRQPYFGAGVALQTDDFAATAGAGSVGTVGSTPQNGYYVASLNATGLTNISKTSSTQLRLGFQLDDNDDMGADYLAFYSANSTTSSNRPILEIVYYIP